MRLVKIALVFAVTALGTLGATNLLINDAKAEENVPFAPYADITLWPPIDLAQTASEMGNNQFTLAFIQSMNGCNPGWAGTIEFDDPIYDFEGKINALRDQGGDVIVSLGGAAGTTLAQSCSDVTSLKDAYRSVIDQYDVYRLDFDIEGAAVADPTSIALRSAAIAVLQQELASEGKSLEVSLTLAVLPQGLTTDGVNVVQSAKDAGVDVSIVNIMAMDYGDSAAPNPDGQMGKYAIDAATNLQRQLAEIYPELSDAELWQRVGITPMIGQNDVESEILTVSEAAEIAAFAQEKQIGRLSMWSVHRDQPCPNGPSPWASAVCSGIDADEWAFANVFSSTSTPIPPTPTPPTVPPTLPPNPGTFTTEVVTASDWGAGYCADVKVTNISNESANWQVTYTTEGNVSSLWNATWSQNGREITAQGVAWNAVLAAGASTQFGFCADRDTPPPPSPTPTPTLPPSGDTVDTDLAITSDWGSGYCAAVKVTNGTSDTVNWAVTLPIEGTVSGLWDADWTQTNNQLSVSGLSWNDTITPGASIEFGFCATR